jgi:GntR family transcriptional regulator / MocR family aminotransferase
MPKAVSSLALMLGHQPPHQTLTSWLYAQLRLAIIEGRLRPGTRLPASRDFARQYRVSRGTVVSVFERLQDEGYVSCRVGAGTRVNDLKSADRARSTNAAVPAYIRRVMSDYVRPKPWRDLVAREGIRPFCMREPAIAEFPAQLWGKMAARRARTTPSWLQEQDDGRGYRPLREAISDYLGTARGVRCEPDQIIVVSGVQQALDLLSRLLLKRGDAVWMEDPGYFGATIAFESTGAQIIPVPVDKQGLSVSTGLQLCQHAKGVYLTPAHQFPLGITMSLERRLEVLQWASRVGAFVIEDDYDSEYRFDGPPIPAMQSLDRHSNVIFVGSFNKLLYPSLRIGYLVLPPSLVGLFLAFRHRTDFHNLSADQVVLCDFIAEGHFGRHLRRMRDLYAGRLAALIDSGDQYLKGLLEISPVRAGLYTAAFLKNDMTSWQAEKAAAAHDLDVVAIDRYALNSTDLNGVILGFAAFDEEALRAAVIRLAAVLEPVNNL